MRSKPHYIFISHAHDFDGQYHDLIERLQDVPGFTFEDQSIPPDDPLHTDDERKIKTAINDRIKHSSIVLVVGGKFASKRRWIKYELKMARQWKRKIIVVRQRQQPRIPQEIVDVSDAIAKWDGPDIVAKIRELVP